MLFLLLVVVGDTRACKSSSLGYGCIMMSCSCLSNFSFGPVQDPQFLYMKIDHEARVTRQVVAF
jgi:hypothetical protein